jgi:DNA-binding transcriptional regulator YhcF (GntR family)
MRERRVAIDSALEDRNCPSLLSVANDLGVSRQTVWRAFPTEAAAITARARQARRSASTNRRELATQALTELIERLNEAGRPATTRNIFLESRIMVTRGSRYEGVLRELIVATTQGGEVDGDPGSE